MNSDDLKKLHLWKLRLQAKKANKPLDSDAVQYEGGRAYPDMSPEVKLIFDALSEVLEALAK
jgi:hypothetical protein